MGSCNRVCANCSYRVKGFNFCSNVNNTEYDGQFVTVIVKDTDTCEHFQPDTKNITQPIGQIAMAQ